MSADVYHPRNSVTGDLPTFRWSTEESVRYEVALEALCQLVASCSARIAEELASTQPRQRVIDECRRLMAEFVTLRRTVRRADERTINAIFGDFPVLQRRIEHL